MKVLTQINEADESINSDKWGWWKY